MSQLSLPDALEQVLCGARARLCGAFDEALEVVEAVRVLASEPEVPGRLAEPTRNRREVARLIAGVAPERVRVGRPVRAREELSVEQRDGRGRRSREDFVVAAEEARAVGVDARQQTPPLPEAEVDHDGRGRIGAGCRGLRREHDLYVRQGRIARVAGAVASERGERLV